MASTQTDRTKNLVVSLTEDEVAECRDLGERRDGCMGHAGNGVDPDERTDIHIVGAKGEFAVAKLWGIDPHDYVGGPDDGVDYRVVVNGVDVGVDVKAKRYFGDEELWVRPDHLDTADVFVLTGVDGDRVNVVGYITASQVRSFDPDTHDGRTVYRIAKSELNGLPKPEEVRVKE